MSPLKRKLAVAVASLVCSLAAYRVFLACRSAPAAFPDYDALLRFDPRREGGHLLPDMDLKVRSDRAGVGVRWVTNSKGFRSDREFTRELPEGTFRILFLGDSFVDGHRTDQEDTIGWLLERALNESLPPSYSNCEVMISGHNNPTTAWYSYQEHGRHYRPQLVLLGLSLSNDFTWNNYGIDMTPVSDEQARVRLEWSGRYRPDSWALPHLSLPWRAYCDDAVLRARCDQRSNLPRIGDGSLPVLGPGLSGVRRVPAAGFHASIGLYLSPLMPRIEAMYVGVEEVLTHFARAVHRDGARMLVTIFPTRIQVYESQWFRLTQAYGLDEEQFDLGLPNRRVAAVLEEAGVPCLDLLADFQREGEAQQRALFRPRGDSHFNERGQEVAAEALFRAVAPMLAHER